MIQTKNFCRRARKRAPATSTIYIDGWRQSSQRLVVANYFWTRCVMSTCMRLSELRGSSLLGLASYEEACLLGLLVCDLMTRPVTTDGFFMLDHALNQFIGNV
jgi:hypothetical protein